ncbi:MAG: Rrf2 family transcriptional regulator [Myxococcales bacterium]|nr:Rrf2 family transcriptional regulator [Myxococcales bacterium]
MNLQVRTDYAIRMLIHLAASDGTPQSIAVISEAYGVSEHHLAKVAQRLRELGYVSTVRGAERWLRSGDGSKRHRDRRSGTAAGGDDVGRVLRPLLQPLRHHGALCAAVGLAPSARAVPGGPRQPNARGSSGRSSSRAGQGVEDLVLTPRSENARASARDEGVSAPASTASQR